MILGFIALLLALGAGIFLLNYSDRHYNLGGSVAVLVGISIVVSTIVGFSLYAFLAFNWVGSQYQADIINREYKTNYTRAEVFYGSDVIDTIQQLQRKRIEINGDIMRDKADK